MNNKTFVVHSDNLFQKQYTFT